MTGDIGEADSIPQYLADFACLPTGTFFVLGNHDFYRGSIARVSADVAALSSARQQLTWLTNTGCAQLNPEVAIVGDDGWSDGRLGNPTTTPIMLNDFHLIEELTGLSRCRLVQRLNELGDQAASRLRPKLHNAASQYANVVILTHAPPFEGACWHEGRTSSPRLAAVVHLCGNRRRDHRGGDSTSVDAVSRTLWTYAQRRAVCAALERSRAYGGGWLWSPDGAWIPRAW